ncbi:MAG: hypothetical protein ACK5Q5_10515 [Planctomycetaceae bacterium]
MHTPSGQRRHFSARCNWQRVWVTVLLLVSLWRGPLPWCHNHAAPESAAHDSAELAWHVRWLHHAAAIENVDSGWHWHFVLPNDIDGDGRQDGEFCECLLTSSSVNGDGKHLGQSSGDSPEFIGYLLTSLKVDVDPMISSPSYRGFRPDSGRTFRSGPDVRLLASVTLC